jgi:hypothetical protein
VACVGPPKEVIDYFGVNRFSEVYDRLAEREPEAWVRQYRASSLYRDYVGKRLEAAAYTMVDTGGGGLRPVLDPVAALRGEPTAFAPTEVTTGNEPPVRRDDATAVVTPVPGSVPADAGDRTLLDAREAAPPSPSSVSNLSYPGLVLPDASRKPPPKPPRPPAWHQFRVLVARYAELVWSDRRSLVLLLLQAPIVAFFVLLGFAGTPFEQPIVAPRPLEPIERAGLEKSLPYWDDQFPQTARLARTIVESDLPVVPDRVVVDPRFNYMLLFITSIVVMWFGCNNAAKEIVKEEGVYARERAVNLGIAPYLASKFVLQSVITGVQTVVLVASVFGFLELAHLAFGVDAPHPGYHLSYAALTGVLVLLGATGVALGLVLSASVSSPDRANTLLPYVLIPQIILGGGILSVESQPLKSIAVTLSPVYWAFRGVRTGETEMPLALPAATRYDDALWIPCAAMAAQTTFLLVLAAACLRGKDLGAK